MPRGRARDITENSSDRNSTLIRKAEDEMDVRESKKALADMKRKGLRPVAYSRVRERLGFK